MIRRAGIAAGVTVVALSAAAWGARAGLRAQAAVARRRIGKPLGEDAVPADRVWRRRYDGTPLDLVLLGDSLAAGLGAGHRKETLGGRLAKGLARRLRRPVRLTTAAVVGSETADLAAQLDGLPDDYQPELAVIVVGGNDVTHVVPTVASTAHLVAAITRLRHRGARVVVGTCPDLGTLRPVPQPLRSLVGRRSAQLAAAQAQAAREAGATPVDLRHLVGPVFRAEPDEMFSLDQFHPSAAGYRHTAKALLPAMLAALHPPA